MTRSRKRHRWSSRSRRSRRRRQRIMGVGAALLLAFGVFVVATEDPRLWVLGLFLAAGLLVVAGTWVVRTARTLRARWVLARTDMDRIDGMSGAEFEVFVADLMRDSDYRRVTVVGRAGDGGVDIRAETPHGVPCAVQCKRRKRPVQPNDVRAFLGVLSSTHRGYLGVFVASNGFTEQAAKEAAGEMTLVDRAALALWLTGKTTPGLLDRPS